ncbi:MAG: hypothetical protein ACE5GH_05315, partial [Fidelibacterota bacterium]
MGGEDGGESTLVSALSAGDLEMCRQQMKLGVKDESSLRGYFQSLFRYACSHPTPQQPAGETISHPLVVLNALKNLVSLRLDRPSKTLMEYATRLAAESRPEEPDDGWLQVPAEILAQPLVVLDLLWALEEGDRERAFREAARISLVSENKFYVMEILTEVCLHEFERWAPFGYALNRTCAFCRGKDIKSFVWTLLNAISRHPVRTVPSVLPKAFRVGAYASPVLGGGDLKDVVMLAVAHRFWHLDSVKQATYRKGISGWLLDRYGTPEDLSEEPVVDPPPRQRR